MNGNINPKIIGNLNNIYNELEQKGLSTEMIVTLLHDKTKIGKPSIRRMLNALISLEREIEINLAKKLSENPK